MQEAAVTLGRDGTICYCNARLSEMLGVEVGGTTKDRKFTLAEMTELGFDTYILAADVIVPLLSEAGSRRSDENGPARQALATLKAWNRRSSAARRLRSGAR